MKIEITDEDFHRLQALAEPLVDTPATVVARLLDFFETGQKADLDSEKEEKPLPGLSFEIPPLTHTKLLMARFNGKEPDRLTWDGLLRLALEESWKKAEDFQALKSAAGANMVDHNKSDQGYKYLPNLKLSYQGVSAEDAVKIIKRLTGYLWTECEFEFEWRNKPGACMPGKRAYGHIGGELLKVSWDWPSAKN